MMASEINYILLLPDLQCDSEKKITIPRQTPLFLWQRNQKIAKPPSATKSLVTTYLPLSF